MRLFLVILSLFFSFGSLSVYSKSKELTDHVEYDELGRLISYPNKIEIICPKQTQNTGVLLIIGQSNSANHAQKKMLSRYPGHVYNYFDGKCYEAASPLIGTTGTGGEFMTPLADFLIEFGVYKDVVIIPSGINGSSIQFWKKGEYLNEMLMSVLDEIKGKYKLTEIVWHQGETDYFQQTPKEEYIQSFYSLVDSIRGTNTTPFFYAIATRCNAPGQTWYPDNPIALAQKTFANEEENIYLGPDTDSLLTLEDRYEGHICHFSETGQLKTAYGFASAILEVKERNQLKIP